MTVLDRLSKRQRRIYDLLQITRCMHVEQAAALNQDASFNGKTDRDILALKKKSLAFSDRDYLLATPRDEKDQDMEDALWIMLRQVANVPISQVYRPEEPAVLGFVKPDCCYEILVDRRDLEPDIKINTLHELEKKFQDQQKSKKDDFMRYLYVVRDTSFQQWFPKKLNLPYIIVLESYLGENGEVLKRPTLKFFYPKGEIHD